MHIEDWTLIEGATTATLTGQTLDGVPIPWWRLNTDRPLTENGCSERPGARAMTSSRHAALSWRSELFVAAPLPQSGVAFLVMYSGTPKTAIRIAAHTASTI